MNLYEKVQSSDIENLAWFIITLIIETEENMLKKLNEYGLEIDLVSLDPRDTRSASNQ